VPFCAIIGILNENSTIAQNKSKGINEKTTFKHVKIAMLKEDFNY